MTARADHEAAGDLSVAEATGDQAHDLALAVGELGERGGRAAGVAAGGELGDHPAGDAGRDQRVMVMAELGRRLGLSSGGTTALIQRLDALGYVTLAPHPRDRRSRLVTLSARGATALDREHAAFIAAVDELANAFSPEVRSAIGRFLERASALAETTAERNRTGGASPLSRVP